MVRRQPKEDDKRAPRGGIELGEPDDGLRAPLRRGVVLFIYSGVVPRRAGRARFWKRRGRAAAAQEPGRGPGRPRR